MYERLVQVEDECLLEVERGLMWFGERCWVQCERGAKGRYGWDGRVEEGSGEWVGK
jgi:hypothetical protein